MVKETQIYGNWENIPTSGVGMIGHGRMELTALQLVQSWQRCSLISDFWAKYIALSSPEFSVDPPVRREVVEGTLSFLLNELFENAAKFSGGLVDELIFEFWSFPERISLQVTNHIESANQEVFVRLIKELLGNDPEKLYFHRLEENAETNQKDSGLGYLTLMNDYKVRFGFRFTPVREGSIVVDVQAHIQVKEI
jgi:hypothetical protein